MIKGYSQPSWHNTKLVWTSFTPDRFLNFLPSANYELWYQHTEKAEEFGRLVIFTEHLLNWERGEKMYPKYPHLNFFPPSGKMLGKKWQINGSHSFRFPPLQKAKNCCSHCYKQQLNKTYYFSTSRVAGLQNMAHQMGHGQEHTVFRAWGVHLGYT